MSKVDDAVNCVSSSGSSKSPGLRRSSILVIPNYHVYSRENADHDVVQKPNEMQFYTDLCGNFDKVVLAAACKDLDAEQNYEGLNNTRAQFVSLGRWRPPLRRVPKVLFYVRSTVLLLKIHKRFDLIYFYLPGTNSLIGGLIASLTNRRFGVYLRGGANHAGVVVEALYQFVLKRADFVICTGLALEKYASRFAKRTLQVSPMTPFGPEDTVSPRDPSLSDEVRLLYVGTVDGAKGVFDLITVAGKLTTAGVSTNLRIVGNSRPEIKEDLLHRISDKNLDGIVELSGFVSSASELITVYSDAHIFVFPSTFNEGFPRVLYEAMLAGCLVVAYNLSVYDEFLVDDKNSLLCRPGDVEMLFWLMKEVIADPARFERIAERGRRDVIAHLNAIGRTSHGQQVADLFLGNSSRSTN